LVKGASLKTLPHRISENQLEGRRRGQNCFGSARALVLRKLRGKFLDRKACCCTDEYRFISVKYL
jgi:hypothetical protein